MSKELIICKITDPLKFIVSNIYYIKEKDETKYKKCLCLNVQQHKVLFSYLDDTFELQYLNIYKFELDNDKYNILKMIDSPGNTRKTYYNIQF